MININDIKDVIYCKECPNCYYVEYTDEYYCDRYSVEIEDISRDYCELDID